MHKNDLTDVPAAACPRCGGWTGSGGMAQYARSTTPIKGRTGCTCLDTKVKPEGLSPSERHHLNGCHGFHTLHVTGKHSDALCAVPTKVALRLAEKGLVTISTDARPPAESYQWCAITPEGISRIQRRVLVTNIPVRTCVTGYVYVPGDTTPAKLNEAITEALRDGEWESDEVRDWDSDADPDLGMLDAHWSFETPNDSQE